MGDFEYPTFTINFSLSLSPFSPFLHQLDGFRFPFWITIIGSEIDGIFSVMLLGDGCVGDRDKMASICLQILHSLLTELR